MTTNAITQSQFGNQGTQVLSTKKAAYGDSTFLTLLTTQLKNQTPLEPVDNESFMNQMASYTSMEEQRALNGNMLKLLDYQGVLARMQGLSQGSSLLGKEIDFVGADGQAGKGTVASVFVAESGDVRLKLQSGTEVDLRQIIGINQAPAGTPAANTAS